MTVAEVIDYLSQFPMDTAVVLKYEDMEAWLYDNPGNDKVIYLDALF